MNTQDKLIELLIEVLKEKKGEIGFSNPHRYQAKVFGYIKNKNEQIEFVGVVTKNETAREVGRMTIIRHALLSSVGFLQAVEYETFDSLEEALKSKSEDYYVTELKYI